jgi:GNAT superfamily N-acetyltransferase
MVHELATYERLPHLCHLTAEDLHTALFSPAPALYGHVALHGEDEPAGFALWFLSFSTWEGRHGIYLEDLYVRPSTRGLGLGTALLAALAQLCVERDYRRLELAVLNWNVDALRLYRRVGAQPLSEWTVQRVAGPELSALAGRAYPQVAPRS